MKVKAVIFRPDRTNDIVKPSRKQLTGKQFTFEDCLYVLNADRFQVTWDRNWAGFKKYYATYYYSKGISNPIPVPDCKPIQPKDKQKGDWGPIFDNGIPGTEIANLFNPWFFRIIAQHTVSLWDQIQFYATIATGLGVLYVIYRLHNPVA